MLKWKNLESTFLKCKWKSVFILILLFLSYHWSLYLFRDAAWEREPQAFQDLLHIHKECDAKNCQCPDGRSFTQNTYVNSNSLVRTFQMCLSCWFYLSICCRGSWRLLRCNSCGHKGTHIMCSGLKISAASNSWSCSFCARILHKGTLRWCFYFYARLLCL